MRTSALSSLLCVVMLGTVLVPAPASAATVGPSRKDKAEAREHFEKAAELYDQEDYQGAADELEQAYGLNPEVDTLFAWAQAERLAGDYAESLRLYALLLDGELSDTQRDAIKTLEGEVQAELDAKEQAEREQAEAEAEAEARAQAAADAEAAAAEREAAEQEAAQGKKGARRERNGRAVNLALTGVGGALSAVGIGLIAGGLGADGRVRSAATYADFESAYDPSSGRGRGAVVLYAAGGAVTAVGLGLLITGVVRMSKAKSESPSAVALIPMLSPEQLGLGVVVRGPSWRARRR